MRNLTAVSLSVDKGRDLASIARVLALGETAAERSDIARETGLSDRIQSIVKTAVTAGGISGAWGSELAAYKVVQDSFFEGLRSAGLFFKLLNGGAIKVPLRSKISAVTAVALGHVVGASSAQKISRLSLEVEAIEPQRASAIVVLTEELLRLGEVVDALISMELQGGVVAAVDSKFYGILTAAAATSASSGSTASAVQIDIRTALQALDTGSNSRVYFAAGPDLVKSLSTLTFGEDGFEDLDPITGGELLNTPVVVSDSIPSGEFFVIDASSIAGNALAVELDRYRHGSLQMDDAPEFAANCVDHDNFIVAEQ